LQSEPSKILVLSSQSGHNAPVVEALKSAFDVVEIDSIEQAVDRLRRDHFDAIFSDSADFLPLERALVSQQASLILNTLGEGVCIVDGEGRANWMNRRMKAWPARVHEMVRRSCKEAFDLFSRQVSPQTPDSPAANRSKRYTINIDDQQFFEMIASPVINPAGQVVQVVAVIWDATGTRRLQQKIDAIDGAGREICRLEAEAMSRLSVQERLAYLQDKIVGYTRDLMHFDHFAIRLLDRRTNRLELVIAVGLPAEACNIELHAQAEGNGISGYVAATGRSYICSDVERDPRYVAGLDHARSSLTVPLRLHDKIIGIFNIESAQRAAFSEDDRQFAEIFGRYVAMALNMLNLLVIERASVSHKIADDVCAQAAAPLNDITADIRQLLEENLANEPLRVRLAGVLDNVAQLRRCLSRAAEGPNVVLGADDVRGEIDPAITGKSILIADDEPSIRATLSDILRKHRANVTVAATGNEAVSLVRQRDFDLVLCDIRMPDKTGYDVFAAARKRRPDVSVILMTGFGYDPNHSIVRASQEGLQAVLFKPFKAEQLLAELRKALGAARPIPAA
jgi:CheY-like chemotaxis protein